MTETIKINYSLLLEIKKNQIQMMLDRGYDVGDEQNLLQYHVSDFKELYLEGGEERYFRSNLSHYYIPLDPTSRKPPTYVYYIDAEKPGIEMVRNLLTYLQLPEMMEVKMVIIITQGKISPKGYQELLTVTIYRFQHYYEDELIFNPVKHFMVPRHIPLNEEETAEFLKSNKLKLSQLPLIRLKDTHSGDKEDELNGDPIAKYYALTPGSVVKIERKNYNTEILVDYSLFFRAVVTVKN